jgi:hypothetical protein
MVDVVLSGADLRAQMGETVQSFFPATVLA